MANTFLKRKWTLNRLWELYRDGMPQWSHLFLVLLLLFLATMRVPRPVSQEFFDSVTRGGLQLTPIIGPLLMSLALVFCGLIIELLGVSPASAHLWALGVATSTIILPLTRKRPLDCATAALLAAIFLVALYIRQEKKGITVGLFVVLYIVATAIRPFVLLTIPLFVAFLLHYSSLPEKLRRWWVFLAAVGPLLVFALLFTFLVPQADRSTLKQSFSLWTLGCRLWSLVAAPGRSLFLHSPLLVLTFLGLRSLSAKDEAVGRLMKGTIALGITIAALFSASPPSPAWQAEPFLAFLPLALLPLAFLELPRRKWELRIFFTLGLVIQLLALLAGPAILDNHGQDMRTVYNPDFCPIYRAFDMAYGGQIDFGFLSFQSDQKVALAFGLFVIASLFLLNGAALAHHINQH